MKWNLFLTGIATVVILGFVVFGYLHRTELVVLTPQGSIGMEEREIIGITTILSGIVVIPVFLFLGIFIWKYRSNNPHAVRKHKPNWDHDNWIMETLWWCIPAIIILILSLVIWRSSHVLDPYKPIAGSGEPLTVEVVALNWKWLFIYPELGIATVNQLEIPSGRPVHFIITADAPMNSFWIPSLGGQIMAMPGMKTELNLIATAPGVYEGSSGNISGVGFSGMRFTTTAVASPEFDAWVASVKNTHTILTKAEYEALAVPSENAAPKQYSEVTANLFDTVVMNSMMSDMSMPSDMSHMEGVGMEETAPVATSTIPHRINTHPI